MQLEEQKELQKFIDNLLKEMFGTKKITRGRSFNLPLYQMEDGTYYKHKKNYINSGKTFLRKAQLDCQSILEFYNDDGWLPEVEDFTREEILIYCKNKLTQ